MKKPNLIDEVFKDKVKFDVQNPVVGSLIVQPQENKKKEREYLKQLSSGPSITDIDIGKRLKESRDFNKGRDGGDSDDDHHEPGVLPTLRPSSSRTSGDIFPTPPYTPAADDDDNLTPAQRFLLDRPGAGSERVAEAIGQELTTATPRRVAFSDNITRVFPAAWKIDANNDVRKDYLDDTTSEDISEIKAAIGKLTRGKEPKQLRFYSGGEKEVLQLITAARQRLSALSEENEAFLKYLSINGRRILAENKIKIHIESSFLFINNVATKESIYVFLAVQEDDTKKTLQLNINIDVDLNCYLREVVSGIRDDVDDLRTNSVSKFLFYNFNTFRISDGLKSLPLRHSQIAEDGFALKKLQNIDWPQFIETLISYSNRNIEYNQIQTIEKRNTVDRTIKKLNRCKKEYNSAFISVGKHLKETLKNKYPEDLKKIEEDLKRVIYYEGSFLNIPNSTYILSLFNRYFFATGSFPTESNFAYVPEGFTPPLIKSYDKISPAALQEKFQLGDTYGLASVQFLAALNIFIGGQKYPSRYAMTELFHNLTMQALDIENKIASQSYAIA